ncbi:MAG: hypothetical protein IPM42_20560 [Saprospiraceae bacterium]|nr:hypothetical protein [Saprospiraceae bacterium]
MKAGKPKLVSLKNNVYPAGKPKVTKSGKPRICTPGQDTFLLPKTVDASLKIVPAETPEIVLSKEATSKDENPYSFSSLGIKNGMKSVCITTIFEDKAGNIWIGMCDESGVTKYDGKYFTNYHKNKNLYKVVSILEDKEGNIWFGGENGLLKYDGKYYTTFTNPDIPVNVRINSLLEDFEGNIWIGTNGSGLIKYNGRTFTHFTQKQGLSYDFVNSILQDNIGNIWLGTDDGLSKFDGLTFYNYGVIEGFSYPVVNSIVENKAGHLWLGTYGGGIFKFDQESFIQYTEEEGLNNNYVFSMVLDNKENLWVATAGNGISVFDNVNFTGYSKNEGFVSIGIANMNIILKDKHDKLWFGTQTEGIIQYSGNQFNHLTEKDGILSSFIGAISKDRRGELWFGGFDGVSTINKNNSEQLTEEKRLFNTDLWSLCVDKSDQFWIGTGSGLIRYDGIYFTKILSKSGHFDIWVPSITEDSDGNIWIGTDHGLIKYSGNLLTYFSNKNDFGNKVIYAIMEDKNKNIWLGTNTGASKLSLFQSNDSIRYSITNFTEKHGLGKGDVRSIYEDSFGNIWVATLNGLSRLQNTNAQNKDHYFVTTITTNEGLSSNQIYSIFQDKSENLWIGSISGLDKLSPEKLNELNRKIQTKDIKDSDVFFKNFNQNDGFFGVGVLGGKTIQEDRTGKLWIGSLDRLTILDPKGESIDTTTPIVELIDVSIYSEKIDWIKLENKKDTSFILGNGVRFQNFYYDSTGKWYGLPQNLSLASNNNYITFRFVGITLNQAHKVKYKYQLVGLDHNWSAVTDKNEAQYGNLPSGSYTFMVKSMNSEGIWSEPLEYNLTIRHPWFRTWLAYCIYIALFLYASRQIHLYQKAKTIRKERERSQQKELEQAKEIETAYKELESAHEHLKSTQAQLIQSEKMASLGELTAGIAHEIQNPLNFVNNFSEVSSELIVDMVDEVDNGNYDEVKAIAMDVQQNLEKINHHGQRASSIVKGMLEHSRKSSGEKELSDINALCDEYLRLAYHGLRAKDKSFNATMETHFDPNLPKIKVIPQDIGRVILNLINNAFYAVSEKSKVENQKSGSGYEPTVSITTQLIANSQLTANGQQPTANSQQLIAIKDNGSGIPAHIKDKIFQPFFTTKPTGQGTGLGLSLAYDIVKAHGGELTVESAVDKGTEFTIKIPIA